MECATTEGKKGTRRGKHIGLSWRKGEKSRAWMESFEKELYRRGRGKSSGEVSGQKKETSIKGKKDKVKQSKDSRCRRLRGGLNGVEGWTMKNSRVRRRMEGVFSLRPEGREGMQRSPKETKRTMEKQCGRQEKRTERKKGNRII